MDLDEHKNSRFSGSFLLEPTWNSCLQHSPCNLFPTHFQESLVFSFFITTLPASNGGVTCPAKLTRTTTSNDFRPHPHAGGSGATTGSEFTQGWVAILAYCGIDFIHNSRPCRSTTIAKLNLSIASAYSRSDRGKSFAF